MIDIWADNILAVILTTTALIDCLFLGVLLSIREMLLWK